MSSKVQEAIDQLIRRAAASYLKESGDDWPTKHSAFGTVRGARYVVIRGARRKLLAVYRVDRTSAGRDQVRLISSWPPEVELLGK